MTTLTWICAVVVVGSGGALVSLLLYGLNDLYPTTVARDEE